MCRRFTLRTSQTVLIEHFGLTGLGMHPRYNIAPWQLVCVIVGGETVLVKEMRWGLLSASCRRRINLRAETVSRRPAFRESFLSRRCLVPADGFFHWRKEGKIQQPYLIEFEATRPFALAGVFARNEFVILTTPANKAVEPLCRRMPVILPPEAYSLWLDLQTSLDQLQTLLAPCWCEAMRALPVSRRVNNPAYDEPACVKCISRQGFVAG